MPEAPHPCKLESPSQGASGSSRRATTLPAPALDLPARATVTRLALAVALAGALVGACAAPHRSTDWLTVREITPPSVDSLAADPAVSADAHGRVAVTWVVRSPDGARDLWLAVSGDSGATFESPVRVNAAVGSVMSYPEGRPSTVFGPSGAMIVAWTSRRAAAGHGVDIITRSSGDGGVTLGAESIVNDDPRAAPAFHGFPALAFRGDGNVFAAWLDERNLPPIDGERGESALYCATSRDGGQTWSANRRLRDTVCACCRPVVATDGREGIALAYRSASRNLRDPALAVSLDGGTTFVSDTVLHADGWYLEGCPDVGPALTWNRTGGGQVAWFTGADPAGVYLVPWHVPGGAAGVRRALADSLDRATHPRLVPLGDATLVGVEARPAADTTRTVFAVRALSPAGALTPWMFLGADIEDGWLTAADARNAFACWIEGNNHRLRVARLTRR